jgi:hypothetical protein
LEVIEGQHELGGAAGSIESEVGRDAEDIHDLLG